MMENTDPMFFLESGELITNGWKEFFNKYPSEVYNVSSTENMPEGWQSMFVKWSPNHNSIDRNGRTDYTEDQYKMWNKQCRIAKQVRQALITSIEYGYAIPPELSIDQ